MTCKLQVAAPSKVGIPLLQCLLNPPPSLSPTFNTCKQNWAECYTPLNFPSRTQGLQQHRLPGSLCARPKVSGLQPAPFYLACSLTASNTGKETEVSLPLLYWAKLFRYARQLTARHAWGSPLLPLCSAHVLVCSFFPQDGGWQKQTHTQSTSSLLYLLVNVYYQKWKKCSRIM